jgi:hypothetical protein
MSCFLSELGLTSYVSTLVIVLNISFGAGAKPNLVLGDTSTHALTTCSNNGVRVWQSRQFANPMIEKMPRAHIPDSISVQTLQ